MVYYCRQYFDIMNLYTWKYIAAFIFQAGESWFSMNRMKLTLKCPNVTPLHLWHSPAASRPAACRDVIAWSWRLLERVLASPRACRRVGISSSEHVNKNVDHTYVFLQGARKRPCRRSEVRCWMQVSLFYLSKHRRKCTTFYKLTHTPSVRMCVYMCISHAQNRS